MRGIIVGLFRSALISAIFRTSIYDIHSMILVVLSTIGALTGVGLCAMGVYELAISAPEFTYHYVFVWMVALGLLIMYIFNIGTSGILYGNNEMRLCILIVAVSSILLCEFWLVLSAPMDSVTIGTDFEHTWSKIYHRNRGELQWIEHRYGCRGFRNATHMPSTSGGDLPEFGGGCLPFMCSAAQDQNRVAIRECMAAVVVQVVVLAVGALIYARDRMVNTARIVEEYAEEEESQAEGPPSASIPAPSASIPAPPASAEVTSAPSIAAEAVLLSAGEPASATTVTSAKDGSNDIAATQEHTQKSASDTEEPPASAKGKGGGSSSSKPVESIKPDDA
ncbi:hypothetical protein LPJ74_001229 [Coemansia sp. RSA 1843]|nr:hypothetical protein LPJ74_001229 [Coemansia sp. RSA 1843]